MQNKIIQFRPPSSGESRTTLTISIRADGSTATSANKTPTDSERYALLRAIRRLRHEIITRYTGVSTHE